MSSLEYRLKTQKRSGKIEMVSKALNIALDSGVLTTDEVEAVNTLLAWLDTRTFNRDWFDQDYPMSDVAIHVVGLINAENGTAATDAASSAIVILANRIERRDGNLYQKIVGV